MRTANAVATNAKTPLVRSKSVIRVSPRERRRTAYIAPTAAPTTARTITDMRKRLMLRRHSTGVSQHPLGGYLNRGPRMRPPRPGANGRETLRDPCTTRPVFSSESEDETMEEHPPEGVTGGLVGKVVGRAKEAAGRANGGEDLPRGGRVWVGGGGGQAGAARGGPASPRPP